MRFPTFKQSFRAAALVTAASFVTPASSQDALSTFNGNGGGPVVSVTHPNGITRDVDCGTLIARANPAAPRGYTTLGSCDFYEQVDYNGQEICNATDNFDTLEPAQQTAALKTALGAAFLHFGQMHGDCVAQAAQIESGGKTEAQLKRIYGNNYSQRTSCTIITALEQCYAAID